LKIDIDETLPEYFFKFTSAKRAIEIVKNSQLWFSNPKTFNDPFDTNIDLIDFEPNDKQIAMVINDKVQGNRRTRREEIKKNNKNAHRIRNQFSEQSNDFFQNSGVCCFSEVNDNILLWAHYANNHKGVCLKFHKTISDITTMTGKVKYRDKYQKASFFNHEGGAIYHLIFTKAQDWHYEQEIRALRILDFGKTDFRIEKLTEIIFGCKTEKRVIQYFKKILADLNLKHIILKQATQTKSSFKLRIE